MKYKMYHYEVAFGFVRDGDTTRETVYSTAVIVYPAPVPVLTVERVLNSNRDLVMLKFSWTDVLGAVSGEFRAHLQTRPRLGRGIQLRRFALQLAQSPFVVGIYALLG